MSKHQKPLGRKAYGSIGHLPESRMGPGDHKLPEGQARIATERPRDRHDVVWVTEKLDGSCTAVANIDGVIVPLGRAGWPAQTSRWDQHKMFASWVYQHQDRFSRLQPGERLVGEWLAQAHGTRYRFTEDDDPWVVFDLFVNATDRAVFQELNQRFRGVFQFPRQLANEPIGTEQAMTLLGEHGFRGAEGPAEGAVWRVERRGKFDFLAKYVPPDKLDGIYLPEISGKPEVWNWRPSTP